MRGKKVDSGRVVIRREHTASTTGSTLTRRTERRYRAALDRLVQGKATHRKYAGRPVKITPAAVAREAGLSRNPLYTTHRALLSEIEAANQRPSPACDLAGTVARLEAKIVELHQDVRRLTKEKQQLATENLAVLHRARQAEDRLTSRDRAAEELRLKPSRLTVVRSPQWNDYTSENT
jgi:hypothetical protein